jgi:hypothetical protein
LKKSKEDRLKPVLLEKEKKTNWLFTAKQVTINWPDRVSQ